MAVQGASGQSANLQEWRNSAGNIIGFMPPTGFLTTQEFRTPNLGVIVGELNTGGTIYMIKANAAQSNPGSGRARLYFRDGTNAGTLKLCVRAGASGAETTILDNIPQ